MVKNVQVFKEREGDYLRISCKFFIKHEIHLKEYIDEEASNKIFEYNLKNNSYRITISKSEYFKSKSLI